MDALGLHAARCARHTGLHRRDDVRDHLAQYARTAGVTATVEQNRPMDEPGARPVHRADVYLIDQQAKEMWLDVRITTATLDIPVERALGEAEARKCQKYRQPRAHPSLLHQGVIPFILEQYGRPAPCARRIADYLIGRRTQHIEHNKALDVAWSRREATQEFWEPISCLLVCCTLRTFAECQALLHDDGVAS